MTSDPLLMTRVDLFSFPFTAEELLQQEKNEEDGSFSNGSAQRMRSPKKTSNFESTPKHTRERRTSQASIDARLHWACICK